VGIAGESPRVGLTGVVAHVPAVVRRARFLLPTGLSRRRQLISAGVAVVVLTLLTLILDARRDHVSTTTVFLLYLAAVVALSAAGGPIVGISVALVAFLLVNWFFTEPLHTLDVSQPEHLVELIIFLAVSATVATLVDTAGRRRDVLEVRTAEAEQLSAANDLRTALLRAVSHDLRTPLASIKAGITSLRQSDVSWSPEDEADLLATIEESSDRLDSLIANLLDMSRVQTGALQPYLRPAAIDEIAPLALRGLAGADAVRLDVPESLPLVFTDAGLLERALANLATNAIRYSPADHPPELVADCHDGVVTIAIVDHGPGVPPADRERMFDPFQRLGDQDMTTGVGLGLAVARGFVEAIGGELVASDTPGGGLTMTVHLTAAPAPAATRGERPPVES